MCVWQAVCVAVCEVLITALCQTGWRVCGRSVWHYWLSSVLSGPVSVLTEHWLIDSAIDLRCSRSNVVVGLVLQWLCNVGIGLRAPLLVHLLKFSPDVRCTSSVSMNIFRRGKVRLANVWNIKTHARLPICYFCRFNTVC